MLAYAARTGLELGADMIKMKYNGQLEEYKWIVRCAGKAKLLVAGGKKEPDIPYLQKVKDVMEAGASGLEMGRGIWQHDKPMKMSAAIKKIIFEGASVDQAMKYLK